MEFDLAKLLRRLQREPRDQVAWAEFRERFHLCIHEASRHAMSRCGLVVLEVQDLVQEFYARLLEIPVRTFSGFRGDQVALGRYLRVLVTRHIRSRARELRAIRRGGDKISTGSELEQSADSASKSPARELVAKEELARVHTALRLLTGVPRYERDVLLFRLSVFHEVPAKKLATVVGEDVTETVAYNAVYRVRKLLRFALESPLEFEGFVLRQKSGSEGNSVHGRS